MSLDVEKIPTENIPVGEAAIGEIENSVEATDVPSTSVGSMTHVNEKKSISSQIVDAIIENDNAELWHSDDGIGYVSFRIHDGHYEHFPLNATSTKQWLGRLYHSDTGRVANSSALNDAITALEGYALDSNSYPMFVRVAHSDDAIYIDMGNDKFEAIKITSSGWEVTGDIPVKFFRPKGLRALPFPERGGSLNDLRPILNIKDERTWLLIKGWLIGSVSPRGPYSLLAIMGEQGSAKTWLAKILKHIIDPHELGSRRPPKTTDDLMISARNNWIVGADNISRIKDWLSDDLCNLSTGGGLAKRKLYSDADEITIQACRPIILNGIEDIVTRQDLLDRSIVVNLSRISDGERRPEKELLKEFENLHPKVLGALLDAAVIGLRNVDSIKLDSLPRMADFARWVAAALGDEGPEFLDAYIDNRNNAIRDVLGDNPIVTNLQKLLDRHNGKWSGTATELLMILNEIFGEVCKPRDWPRAPNALSGILRRLTPSLRSIGIDVEFYRNEGLGSKIITLTRELAAK